MPHRRPPRFTLVLALLVGALVGGPAARAGRLVAVHLDTVVVLEERGQPRPVPFRADGDGVARFALNDAHRVLRMDRKRGSRAMGFDRLQVYDLRSAALTPHPFATKRVRRNRILKLLRLLPGTQGFAYQRLDNYQASPFTLRGSGRVELASMKRFAAHITALTVLPDGQHLVVHHPGFNQGNERRRRVRGYGDYLRGLPQTLYYGQRWGGPLKKLVRHAAFEWMRLVDRGRHAVYLVPGPPSKAWRTYALRSLQVTTGKEVELARFQRPYRGQNSEVPPVLAFLESPDLVVLEGRRYHRYVATRPGRQTYALPPGAQVVPALDCLADQGTGLHPYLVTSRWLGRVGPRTFRYAIEAVRVRDGRVVFRTIHVGSSLNRASYLP